MGRKIPSSKASNGNFGFLSACHVWNEAGERSPLGLEGKGASMQVLLGAVEINIYCTTRKKAVSLVLHRNIREERVGEEKSDAKANPERNFC